MSPNGMSATPPQGTTQDGHLRSLRVSVFALFFIFGGITSLNDVIVPKLKGLFTLNYAQVMLVNSAFFAAYFLISIPGAAIVARIGYMRTAVVGLLAMMVGCLLFVPASSSGRFVMFLGALFVLASGITIVQVVANPLISMLGKPDTAHSRLTFAQAFNSFGTTIFPYLGSIVILGSLATVAAGSLSGQALNQYRARETQVIVHTYLGLATALALVAAAVWLFRNRLKEIRSEAPTLKHAAALLRRVRFGYGTLCIFLYVGELPWRGPAGCGQARTVLLGRRHGRALHRGVHPAHLLSRLGAGRRRGRCDHAPGGVGQYGRRGIGLVAAGHRAVQLDHVSDHLLARL
jgi:MFS transporter, FHS family, L-fucose permease